MGNLTDKEKHEAVKAECNKYVLCNDCPLRDKCRTLRDMGGSFESRAPKLYDAYIDFFESSTVTAEPHRITIRDIVDLLDYDRTGIRTLRIVDDDTKQSDMLRTDSYLMQYIEDTAVNTLDTVNGVITLYVDYGGRKDG